MSSISRFLLPFSGESLLDDGSVAAAGALREARAGIAKSFLRSNSAACSHSHLRKENEDQEIDISVDGRT